MADQITIEQVDTKLEELTQSFNGFIDFMETLGIEGVAKASPLLTNRIKSLEDENPQTQERIRDLNGEVGALKQRVTNMEEVVNQIPNQLQQLSDRLEGRLEEAIGILNELRNASAPNQQQVQPSRPLVEKVERIPTGQFDQATMGTPASQPVTTSKPSDMTPEQQKLLNEAQARFGGNQ